MRSDRLNQAWMTLGVVGLAAGGVQADLTTNYQSLITGTAGLTNYWSFEDAPVSGSNLGTVADVIGGQNGTVIGTVESQAGLVGNAGFFPGDTDGGSFNNLVEILGSDTSGLFDLQGSFTIEAIVRTDTLPADNWSGIFTKGDSAWRLARNSGNDYIQGAANGLAGGVTNASIDLDNDVWHYVALTYDQNTGIQTVFFDDAAEQGFVAPGQAVNTNSFTVMIGGNAERPEREWLGFIDEVAVYNRALTGAEITSRLSILDADPGAIDQTPPLPATFWTGAVATGSFASGNGWANATAPVAGDIVRIGNGGEVTFAGGSLEIDTFEVGTNRLTAGQDSDGDGKLVITSGTLIINGSANPDNGTNNNAVVGQGARGEVLQTGGEVLFAGDDFEIGEDPNGEGVYTMTGGLLQIGSWTPDNRFDNGWFMTNDNDAGDDLAIGRDRTGENTAVASGILDMSGDAEVRVANDMFLDVGYAEVHMTDTTILRVGDDLRAASADRGEGFMDIRGNALVQVEGRFSIADSNLSQMDVTVAGDAVVEIGRYLVVAGQDNLNESGVGTLTIEDNALINVGSIIYRGDVDGDPGVPNPEDKVADEHRFYIGTGNNGQGSGAVYQTGAGSLLTIGRQADIGYRALGSYEISAGAFEVRGDGPISGIDFPTGLRDDSGFVDGGGDVFIGSLAGSDGTFTYRGGDVSVFRDFVVGLGGSGRLVTYGPDSQGDADTVPGTFIIGGDLGFGGDFAGSEGGAGAFAAGLNASGTALIEVTGDNPETFGDLYIYEGTTFELLLASGFRPEAGSTDRFVLITYAGDRYASSTASPDTGVFDELSVLNTLGIEYSLDYSVPGEIAVILDAVYLAGDANFDNTVDLIDLSALASSFGSPANWTGGDFNADGVVDLIDLSALASSFGTSVGNPVPEPTSAAIALLGLAAVATRRRVA